ncbi:MAG: L-threonylcarbamoyladenylate synthase [Phenylobacterium sp.]|jgi:L-threonylcarbamoyladenylate synthase
MNNDIDPAIIAGLHQGDVIAYPTEAVYGLGCDPDNQQAVEQLLAIKQRPISKGLILIAADYAQLQPYINDSLLSAVQKSALSSSWPGPTTWVIPAADHTPKWLTGRFDTLAVRVSAHPVVRQLCRQFAKPLVSTSANLTNQPAISDIAVLQQQLGDKVSHIVPGSPNPDLMPSQIIDALSGIVYRS